MQSNGDASLITAKKREREATKETDPLQVYVNTLGVDALLPLFTAMNFERAMPDSSTMMLRNQICAFAKTAAPDDPINYIRDLDLGMATIDTSGISSSPCKPPSKKGKVNKAQENPSSTDQHPRQPSCRIAYIPNLNLWRWPQEQNLLNHRA